MKFSTLKRILDECPTVDFFEFDQKAEFHAVFDYSAQNPFYQDSALYYGSYSMLSGDPRYIRPGDCLLVYINEKNPSPLAWKGFTCVAAISDYAAYNQALVLLQNAMELEAQLKVKNRRILEAIISGANLQQITNLIAEMSGHYTDILDNAMNILAVSETVEPPVSRLNADHSLKVLAPGIMEYLRKKGYLERILDTRKPVYIASEEHGVYAYCIAIYSGGLLNSGFLTNFVKKGEYLSPVVLAEMEEAAAYLSLMMQRTSVSRSNKATFFTHLLSGMLQGHPSPDASYKDKFTIFRYELRQYKRIAVIPTQTSVTAAIGSTLLADTIQPMLPNCVYVNFGQHIVFLMSESEPFDLSGNPMLEDFLKQNQLKMGVSLVFEEETSVKSAYETAVASLELGERLDKEKNVYYYYDYKITDIIEHVASSRDIDMLCFRPLLVLMKEDAKDSKGELVKTLFAYLNNAMSVQKTCEELYIHRNTLYYRLQRIREIMDCDFTEFPILVDIAVSSQLLRYIGKWPLDR